MAMKQCFDCKLDLPLALFMPAHDDFCIHCHISRGDVLCECGCDEFMDPSDNVANEDEPICCAQCAKNRETMEDIRTAWRDVMDSMRREGMA